MSSELYEALRAAGCDEYVDLWGERIQLDGWFTLQHLEIIVAALRQGRMHAEPEVPHP